MKLSRLIYVVIKGYLILMAIWIGT